MSCECSGLMNVILIASQAVSSSTSTSHASALPRTASSRQRTTLRCKSASQRVYLTSYKTTRGESGDRLTWEKLVDENGRATGETQVYALCGFVRGMGEGDDALNRLAQRDGFLKNVWSANRS
jgi:hypothetical protein